ncbi:hypothetical protein HZS_4630, partial [Henneguya salminicola]
MEVSTISNIIVRTFMASRLKSILRYGFKRIKTSSHKTFYLCGIATLFPMAFYIYKKSNNYIAQNHLNSDEGILKNSYNDSPLIPYVVIGNGTAAYYATLSIRKSDPNARVLLISKDKYLPYSFETRNKNAFFSTELVASKDLSDEDVDLKYSFPLKEQAVLFDNLLEGEGPKISYLINTDIIVIDSDSKKLVLDDNEILKYNKLIIATEMKSIKHEVLQNEQFSDNVIVINNSFYCSIVLAKNNGLDVYHIVEGIVILYHKGTPFYNFLPKYLVEAFVELFKKSKKYFCIRENINLMNNKIISAENRGDKLILNLNENQPIETDIAIIFNEKMIDDEFILDRKCRGSKCPEKHPYLSKGYYVDSNLRVKEGDIFIAGDNSILQTVSESYPNLFGFDYSYFTGKLAGQNSTGLDTKYEYLPFKIYNISETTKFQTIGLVSSDLESISVWKKPEKDQLGLSNGIVYFHKNNIIMGIVLWNIQGKLDLCEEVYFTPNIL